jgi:hypothetical protein
LKYVFFKKTGKSEEKARPLPQREFGFVKKGFKNLIFLVGSVCYAGKILIFVA